jgi:hypothetical protein
VRTLLALRGLKGEVGNLYQLNDICKKVKILDNIEPIAKLGIEIAMIS